MRTITIINLYAACSLLMLVGATSADPIQDERSARDECSAYSQAGMRDCLEKKLRESEKSLKQAEDNANSALCKWDEDAKQVSAAKNKLKSANTNYVRYRDSQCAFAASLGGGAIGNALEIRRIACVAELNNRRATQLRSAVAELPIR
ncbi:MAG TPA: lysozyme inhibitor LprI family protein [Thiobacillus sp.]